MRYDESHEDNHGIGGGVGAPPSTRLISLESSGTEDRTVAMAKVGTKTKSKQSVFFMFFLLQSKIRALGEDGTLRAGKLREGGLGTE